MSSSVELNELEEAEMDVCMVCMKSTLDENGDPIKDVLLCGDGECKGCDRECHLACSGLSEVPADGIDWFCVDCVKDMAKAKNIKREAKAKDLISKEEAGTKFGDALNKMCAGASEIDLSATRIGDKRCAFLLV